MAAFALDLDHDGIRLLRKADDGWHTVDEVALDDPELPKRLREMRITAELKSEGPLETELIIPPSQILYARIPVPEDRPRLRDEDVISGLEGLTPCPVSELVFDWRRDGDTIQVAALDINTLDEAENFATTYGFNPMRFIAQPDPGDFPDVPDFGPTQFAKRQPLIEQSAPFSSRRSVEDLVETAEPVAEEPVADTAPETPEPEATPTPVAPPKLAAPAPAIAKPTAPRPELKPEPARLAARRPEPQRPIIRRPSASSVATATGALLTIAILVWTALYLVTPKVDTRLPQIAETPAPTPETDEVPSERAVPRRVAPVLAEDVALPSLPNGNDAPGPGEEMAARSQLALLAPQAPDPTTEVGVLKSADVWQKPPVALVEPIPSLIEGLYVASIDPVVSVDDAFALSPPAGEDSLFSTPSLPPEAGEEFELEPNGLVVATRDGALTPDGVIVIAGAPSKRPPARPATAVAAVNAETALALAGKVPRPRPDNLIERSERAQLGGRSKEELSGIRPRPRPASAQIEAAIEAALQADTSPSPLAIAVSRSPSSRPADFAAIVAAQQAARGVASNERATVVPAAAAAVAPAQPRIPSSASVARQATIESAINLRKLNLIGVYGSASDRRALLRLPSGRYVKVKVGDRIDGGQIGAIGDNELRYIKGGRNTTLTVPSG